MALKRILVVDDQPEFCNMVRELLAGHASLRVVGEAYTGEQALEAMEGLMPDAVLLDVEMPGMGGLAASREINTRFPGVAVVMVSFHSGAEFTHEAARTGALGFIPKSKLSLGKIEEVLGGLPG